VITGESLVLRPDVNVLSNNRAYARARKREHVLCLGDSHVQVMRHVRIQCAWFRVGAVEGATASGVMDPNGVAGSMTAFIRRAQSAPRWQRVLVQLGELDCGFVIWHRAQRHGLSIDEQLGATLDSYLAFLQLLIKLEFREVIVLSAPAPTIPDDRRAWGAVANLRSEISTTQRERTDLTLRFNSELQGRCRTTGASFVDVTTGHVDRHTGLVASAFRRGADEDHHLATRPYSALIAGELSRHFSQ
jgi:hypothetical protein